MKKIVLNGCYGGFGVSEEGTLAIMERKGIEVKTIERDCLSYTVYDTNGKRYGRYSWDRDDEDLIAVVEELGEKANDSCAKLYIEEYDDENFDYDIDEYDGVEDLMLIPVVSEKRLAECKSTTEIVEYLKSIDIRVKVS